MRDGRTGGDSIVNTIAPLFQKVIEYYQEMPQSHTADQATVP